MSKPVADTTLADPLLPPPHFLPLQPATVASTAQEHWPRRPSQGVCSKHLGWWKPWCYPDLHEVWVSLRVPWAYLWVWLLVLPSVNMNLAQLVVLKVVNMQNASRWCWCRSLSPGALSWSGQEPRLCTGYGPTTPPRGPRSLFPPNVWLEVSLCRDVLWGTNTESTLVAAFLLQRISWRFEEPESKLKCSSTLKED